jgi:hypothetical protein
MYHLLLYSTDSLFSVQLLQLIFCIDFYCLRLTVHKCAPGRAALVSVYAFEASLNNGYLHSVSAD